MMLDGSCCEPCVVSLTGLWCNQFHDISSSISMRFVMVRMHFPDVGPLRAYMVATNSIIGMTSCSAWSTAHEAMHFDQELSDWQSERKLVVVMDFSRSRFPGQSPDKCLKLLGVANFQASTSLVMNGPLAFLDFFELLSGGWFVNGFTLHHCI